MINDTEFNIDIKFVDMEFDIDVNLFENMPQFADMVQIEAVPQVTDIKLDMFTNVY